MSTVNMRTIALLTNENLVSCKASFVLDGESGNLYTYVLEKSLADTLKVNDCVAARKADGSIVIVQIRELHDDNEIDIDANWNYQFAFQKIDIAYLEMLENQADEAAKLLNKRRRDNYRKQALAVALSEIKGSVVKQIEGQE